MSLETRQKAFIDNLVGHFRLVTTMINGVPQGGDLTALTTTDKSSLVAALNEVKSALGSLDLTALISDTTESALDKTYSIDKIKSVVALAVADLVDSAPGALDTLKELATALTDNDSELATITTALGNRVSVESQTFTAEQQAQARTNIGVLNTSEVNTIVDNKIDAMSGVEFDMGVYFTTGITAL